MAAPDYWASNEEFSLQRCFVGFSADLSAALVFSVRISRQCLVTVTLLCLGRLAVCSTELLEGVALLPIRSARNEAVFEEQK